MPKVKHFLWRLSHSTLTFRRVLQRKGMKIDTNCCMCGRFDEDGGHLLFKCKNVKEAWRALNLEVVRCDLAQAETAMDMMEKVLKLERHRARLFSSFGYGGMNETNGGRREKEEQAWKWHT